MEDFIIIAVVLCIVGAISFYLYRSKKRGAVCVGCPYAKQCAKKGAMKSSGGGCCSSGGYTPKKKKLPHVLYQKTFKVEGMHCASCKARVEEVVGDIKGVAGVVDLKAGELVVFYAEDVDDELIKARIERAGYTVVGTV